MDKKGLIISGIFELASIIAFIYFYAQQQYAHTLTSNNIAASMVYTSHYFENLSTTMLWCGIAIIVFLILMIYFIRK